MRGPLRRLWVVAVLVSGVALADLPPANVDSCRGATAGAACTTDDGRPGTCLVKKVGRLDYSEGVPPKMREVELLVCVESAPARVTQQPLLAAGVLLACASALVAAALWGRRRRAVPAS